MGSFLDMQDAQRRLYVARLIGLNPNDPTDWPNEIIDRVIRIAERAADDAAQTEVRLLMRGR